MSDLNILTISGRLGNDAELRYMPSGQAVLNMSVAVGSSHKNKATDEWVNKTMWVKAAVFGAFAEGLSKSGKLTKGAYVVVSGRLTFDERGNPVTFEGKSGWGAKFEMVADTVTIAPTPGAGAGHPVDGGSDEDIPF